MNIIQIAALVFAILILESIVSFKLSYDLSHKPKHAKEWLIMAAFGCTSSFLFTLVTGELSVINFIISVCLCMGYIWLFFSGRYGLKVANDFWYTGVKNNPGKAITDKFLELFSKPVQKIIKIAAFLIPLVIYILRLIK